MESKPDSRCSLSLSLRIELTHSAVHSLHAQLGTCFHKHALLQPSLRLRQRTFPAPWEALLLGVLSPRGTPGSSQASPPSQSFSSPPLQRTQNLKIYLFGYVKGGGGPGTLIRKETIRKQEYGEGAGYWGSRRELSLGRGEGLSPGTRGPRSTPAAWSAGTASPGHEDLSVQRLSQECRSCISSSAGFSHCRESQSLTRNRMLTSESEMCLLAQCPRGRKTGQRGAPTGSFKPTL